MHLVFVHGIWDSNRVWRRMVNHLEPSGHECHYPSLIPANAEHGLIDLAEKLHAFVETKVPADKPIAVIAFSMGTVIARYYLQELGGAARTTHLFSIAGPQRGTLTAHFWLGKGSRDMRFGSAYLKQLDAGKDRLTHLIAHNYRTPYDLMVFPSTSNNWGHGEEHIVHCPWHAHMLKHPYIPQHIRTVLDEDSPRSLHSG